MVKKVSIAATLVILVLTVGFFLIRSRASKQEETPAIPSTTVLPTVDPSVEVDLVPREDGHAVILTVRNIPSSVNALEYELSYLTGAGLPKGALSRPIELTAADHQEWTREILLGTCSKNTCSYDEGVKNVSLVLKFHSPTGASIFKGDYRL